MKTPNKKLTIEQAYCCVIDYLNKYYFGVQASDDIGLIVGDMHFLLDGSTADPAAWSDWLKAVNQVRTEKNIHQNNIHLTIDEAYSAMTNFLENYAHLTSSEETRKLLDEKMLIKDGKPVDQENWNEWICSIEKILSQNPLVKPLLILTK